MINVCYIVSTLKKCGGINVLYNIIKYMDGSKFRVSVITLSEETINSVKEDILKLNVNVIQLKKSRLSGFFQFRKLNKIISDNNFHIIHGHGFRADVLNSRLKGKIVFSTLHTYPYHDYRNRYGLLSGTIMGLIHFYAVKRIKHPIACSRSVADLFMRFQGIKLSYIQNGINTDIFCRNDDCNKGLLRTKLHLPLDKKIFIYVGHLIKIKDPLTIVEAFERTPDNVILIMLGKGNLADKCRIRSKNNIKLLGYKDSIPEYLRSADYFISSSLTEGMPNSVLEAMACGLPCILSDIEPHKEIFNMTNKRVGFLFEKGNPLDLREKIIEIMQMNNTEISCNAIDLITNNFTAELMSKRYQKMYSNSMRL